MTAELWTRSDRDMMLEISIRVPASQAAFASAGFMGFLSELGAKRDNALQTKTLWALDYYAKNLSRDTKTAKAKAKPKAKKPSASAKPVVKLPGPRSPNLKKSATKPAPEQAPAIGEEAPLRANSKTRVARGSRTKAAPATPEPLDPAS